VTVRLPTVLYERLEAFAAGRHVHRGRPPLAQYVREAVEEYLDRQQQRQISTTADEQFETYSTLAAASIAVAQDPWTQPRREAPLPREGTEAPALPAGDEPLSKPVVVALILGWYEEGMPKPAIVTRLNAAQVPPIVGRGHWNSRKVTRALWYGSQQKRERQA
jgi:predicted DNA-binding protein